MPESYQTFPFFIHVERTKVSRKDIIQRGSERLDICLKRLEESSTTEQQQQALAEMDELVRGLKEAFTLFSL